MDSSTNVYPLGMDSSTNVYPLGMDSSTNVWVLESVPREYVMCRFHASGLVNDALISIVQVLFAPPSSVTPTRAYRDVVHEVDG